MPQKHHRFTMSTVEVVRTVTEVITKAASASASASSTGTPKVPAQGGVLEKVNPVHYDAKNPIILFIVQVSNFLSVASSIILIESCPGRHYHYLLQTPTMAFKQNPPASCHFRSHRWHSPRTFSHGPHPGLQKLHLSRRWHGQPKSRCKHRSYAILVHRWSRSRLAYCIAQLEGGIERGHTGHGRTLWPRMRNCCWTIQ